ncbi:hypothetical protein GOV13_00010 [Candidatus Pacearchaeota archaeon]|nr:hypothetical protein [Candidatus Pacearchaeota archaeon]
MKWIILFSLTLVVLIVGCNTNTGEGCTGGMTCDVSDLQETKQLEISQDIEKIEVYHFHGANQCHSCITVGDYAEETIKTYFDDEFKSGKIVFGHINAELPENKELVLKYGATGSSLWIGVYDADGFHAEQNTKVWYKINDKEDYMSYLKGVIEQKLSGN